MLTAVCIGSNDLKSAQEYYDTVLATIGMTRQVTETVEIGYGEINGLTNFWVLTPYNRKAATAGNGAQTTFGARDSESVDAFYKAALLAGGTDEGPPGPRDYAPGYYGAYCRDPEGNKLHVCFIPD